MEPEQNGTPTAGHNKKSRTQLRELANDGDAVAQQRLDEARCSSSPSAYFM